MGAVPHLGGIAGMATGKVKWFNNAKGYGFILPEVGGEDLFVHYSSIEMDGYKTLRAGQDVEFEVHEGPKGLHAVNIRAVGADADGEAAPESTDSDLEADAEADAEATEASAEADAESQDSAPARDEVAEPH